MASDELIGWIGEPYTSDFQAAWGIIPLSEMYDGRHIDRTIYAADEAIKAGFKYVITKRPSSHGNHLYLCHGMKCVVGRTRHQSKRAEKVRECYRSDPEVRMRHLIAVAKTRCNKRKLPFSLDAEDICRRMFVGRCEATGIPFDLANVGTAEHRNPFSPSLDQVDPGRGYTKENVMVVCWGWNLMKSNFPLDLAKQFLSALVVRNQLTG